MAARPATHGGLTWRAHHQTKQVKTQLIAHDKAVYDIAFGRGKDEFATVGADGSVRMFDLRHLEHSTIMYESPSMTPLLRVAWNKQDRNYLAAIVMDSPRTVILDVRMPSSAVSQLPGHTACVNGVAWAPHSCVHVCTVGDDSQALIWDLSTLPTPVQRKFGLLQTTLRTRLLTCAVRCTTDPILAYHAGAEINQLQWSAAQPDWVAIAFERKMQVLRV